MASPGNSGDVSSTLGELERKLRELEQELARVGHSAATPNEPLVPPPTPIVTPPQPSAAATVVAVPAPHDHGSPAGATDDRLTALEEQLDALRGYGAELQASAGRLLEAYRRALAEAERPSAPAPAPPAPAPAVQAPAPPPPVPPMPAVPPVPAPAPDPAVRAPIHDHRAQDEIMARFIAAQHASREPSVSIPEPSDAPFPAAPTPAVQPPTGPIYLNLAGTVPAPPAAAPTPIPTPTAAPAPASVAAHAVGALDQRYVGAVSIDAGPFTDISSLSAFEQAVARVPGVRDVYVRGFQGQRAVIDVDLGTPTALVSELAAVTTVPFIVDRADATGLVVTIPPVSPDAS